MLSIDDKLACIVRFLSRDQSFWASRFASRLVPNLSCLWGCFADFRREVGRLLVPAWCSETRNKQREESMVRIMLGLSTTTKPQSCRQRAGKKIPRQSSQTTYFWCRSCPMSVAHHEFVFGSEAAELFGSIHGDCIGWYCTRN